MKSVARLFVAFSAVMVIASMFIAVLPAPQAQALPAGATMGRGYFTGAGFSSGNRVVINGLADCAGNCTNKASFIAWVKGKLNDTGGNSARHRTGAAFIIHTMRNDGSKTRPPTAAEIADWETRVNNPAVALSRQYVSYTVNSSWFSANDVAYYGASDTMDTLVFSVNGTHIYQLKEECANPIGNMPGLPAAANQWSVTPTIAINRTTAAPGDTVTWTHGVRNNGPNALDRNVTFNSSNGQVGTMPSGAGPGETRSFPSTEVAQEAFVGTQRCRATGAAPSAWNNAAGVQTGPLCYTVPYNYNLIPQALAAPSTAQQGDQITWDFNVINNGGTRSQPTAWAIKTVRIPAANYPNGAADIWGNWGTGNYRDNYSCARLIADFPFVGSCVSDGSNTTAFGNQQFLVGNNNTVGDGGPGTAPLDTTGIAVGDTICRLIAVSPPSQNASPTDRHSKPLCTKIGKKPAVQFRGADAWSGGGFPVVDATTGASTCAATSGGFRGTGAQVRGTIAYGSYAEYGLSSTSTITTFPSGGMAPGILPGLLTRANTPSLGTYYGSATTSHCLTDFRTIFGVGSGATNNASNTINLRSVGSARINATNSDVTLTAAGGPIAKGQTTIINAPNSRVVIADNVSYDGNGYTSLSQLPTIVIIARDIVVEADVTQVDAWLQASGTMFTCDTRGDASGRLVANDCNQTITFNGPVSAGTLSLRRNAGSSSPNFAIPAEIFNLRPDAFLSSYGRAQTGAQIQTVHQTELPPRY